MSAKYVSRAFGIKAKHELFTRFYMSLEEGQLTYILDSEGKDMARLLGGVDGYIMSEKPSEEVAR